MIRGDLMISKYNNYVVLGENFYYTDKEKAVKMFAKALDYSDDQSGRIDLLYNIAYLYIDMFKYEKAIGVYEQIIGIDYRETDSHYGLGILYEFLEKWEKSIEMYNNIIAIEPDYEYIHYYIGASYYEMGDYDKAIDHLLINLDTYPDDYMTMNNLGAIYEKVDEDKLAYDYLIQSIDINSEFDNARYNFGVLLNKVGNVDEALIQYYKALELNDRDYLIVLNISDIYIRQGQYKAAVEILSKYLDLNMGELLYNRACAYSLSKNYKKCMEDIGEILKIDSTYMEDILMDEDFENIYELEEFKSIRVNKERLYDNFKN